MPSHQARSGVDGSKACVGYRYRSPTIVLRSQRPTRPIECSMLRCVGPKQVGEGLIRRPLTIGRRSPRQRVRLMMIYAQVWSHGERFRRSRRRAIELGEHGSGITSTRCGSTPIPARGHFLPSFAFLYFPRFSSL